MSEVVRYRNEFVEAIYTLNLIPKKLLIALVYKIQRAEIKNPVEWELEMEAQEACKLVGLSFDSDKKHFEQAIERLMKEVITVRNGDEWTKDQILGPSEYKNGIFKFRFSERIQKLLVNLKECFTAYKLVNIRPLKSTYSIRIYELLKQYETFGFRKFEIGELKKLLSCEGKYEGKFGYAGFKKKVLIVAQHEIKEKSCDIYFTFEEIKCVRSVKWINFIIHKADNPVTVERNNYDEMLDGLKPTDTDNKYAARHNEIEAELRLKGWQGDFKELLKEAGGDSTERFEFVEYYVKSVLGKDKDYIRDQMTGGLIRKRIIENAEKEYRLYLIEKDKRSEKESIAISEENEMKRKREEDIINNKKRYAVFSALQQEEKNKILEKAKVFYENTDLFPQADKIDESSFETWVPVEVFDGDVN